MTEELLETMQIVGMRYRQPDPRVFLYLDDYVWRDGIKSHFKVLRKEGYMIAPKYDDLGVEIMLTPKGREFLDGCPKREWSDPLPVEYQPRVTTITKVTDKLSSVNVK